MDVLRKLFEAMGHSDVETFIASGNVIFDAPGRSGARLEGSIEKVLRTALGYPVATFLRTLPELTRLAAHPLVSGDEVPEGSSLYVGFLREPLAAAAARKVMACRTETDDFQVYDRQLLWTVRGAFLDSKVTGAFLERAVAQPATFRNATTVRRIAKKYGAQEGRP